MDIAPVRTGAQVAVGGAAGSLLYLPTKDAKVAAFGALVGGTSALAQSIMYQNKGGTAETAGPISLAAGIGGGAVAGAALFGLLSSGAPTIMGRMGIGLAAGAGIGLLTSIASFAVMEKLAGPQST